MQVGDLIQYFPVTDQADEKPCLGIVKELAQSQKSLKVLWVTSPYDTEESGWLRENYCRILSKMS